MTEAFPRAETAPTAPRRGFFRRTISVIPRLKLSTAMVAGASLAAVPLLATTTANAAVIYDVPLVPAFALALLAAGSLPVAVMWPAIAGPLALGATLGLQAMGTTPPLPIWPWWPVLIVNQSLLLFIIAVRSNWRVSTASWLASVGAPAILSILQRPERLDPSSVNLVVFASVSGGMLVLGILLAQWNEIRGQLLRERSLTIEEHSRRRLVEERTRIARELHDVIAHGLSIINVQSTTARYRNPGLSTAVEREFDEIAASSRQALAEMRSLLGVLRSDAPSDSTPQPTFDDVRDLVAQAERAGAEVDLVWPPAETVEDVSDVVGLAAYRIVQEALSNAIRHAPGVPITVTGERNGAVVRVVVTSEAAPPSGAAALDGTGFGLIGMRERAASVAGSVTMGVAPSGQFVVDATLPVRGADPATSR